jgi:hypothetical protein
VRFRLRGDFLSQKRKPHCGEEMRTRQVLSVCDSTMDPVHIPVPNSCNCDVVPNEKANTATTLIASRYPIIINDIGLFERIFFIALQPWCVYQAIHTAKHAYICAHYTLSNSQMCISVIEFKRPPIHSLVPLHSGYDEIPPGFPANHIAPNPLGGGVELGLCGVVSTPGSAHGAG